MLSRCIFYPTLLYNVVMEKVSSRQWYNRIDDTVILGALPFKSMASELRDNEGVRGVVSINEQFELNRYVYSAEEWSTLGIEQLHLPTTDFTGVPSPEQLQKGISFILKHGHQGDTVYVHCKAGRMRSATIVACYLVQVNKWSPEEAVSFIKTKRPHIVLLRKHWDAIRDFFQFKC